MTRGYGMASLALALAVLGACAPPTSTLDGTIERLDVEVVVLPDGGLDVAERLTLMPLEGAVSLRRVVETPYADTVVFEAVRIDGQLVEPGAGGVTVDTPDPGTLVLVVDRRDVDAAVELEWEYAVTRAVAVRQPRGRLAWQVLEADRSFDVSNVDIRLRLPDHASIYDGSGMAEPGWDVAVVGDHMTARRERVPAAEGATLLAAFDVDRGRVQQGQWEWDLDRQQEFALALVAAGAFILVVGVGILVLLRVQYAPVPADAADDVRRASRAERQRLARGLHVSSAVTLVVAGLFSAAGMLWMSGLGPALQAIPASMAAVAMMFLIAGWWYARR